MVNQPELELQLKVWKELAISKQMLMRAATDALKLDPNCSQDELKEALESVIKKIAKSDTEVKETREQAKLSITTLEKKLQLSEQALTAAQASVTELQKAKENAATQMAVERSATAKELQKLKDRIAEKDKALKAINTALADSPENVIRKMNTLKKQKQEEADTRREVEAALNTARADKRKVDQQFADLKKSGGKLVTQHRDLHGLCTKLHEQLQPLVADAKDVPAIPELDSKLLEEIEQAGSSTQNQNGSNSKK